jgi:hypothetical protein
MLSQLTYHVRYTFVPVVEANVTHARTGYAPAAQSSSSPASVGGLYSLGGIIVNVGTSIDTCNTGSGSGSGGASGSGSGSGGGGVGHLCTQWTQARQHMERLQTPENSMRSWKN